MKLRRSIILFSIPIITLCSCSGGKDEKPEGILSVERFQKVLLHLYILEGEAEHRKVQYSTDPEEFLPQGTKRVLQEHDLSRGRFIRSYRYYLEDPKRMKRIHEEVLNELMKRKGKKEGNKKENP